ncbi:MAG: pentapeptide repeat-containing protein, partial [Mycobacterium sp.]|nr:pentapeptide repeat-containing protein [Mycobacterium sp.]
LSDVDLSGAVLANTDLSGANLSKGILTDANLITAKLTNALWNETACPHGGKSSTGCSPFPTVPVGDQYSRGGSKEWYEYRSTGTATMPSTPLLGTLGAPLRTSEGGGSLYNQDGVQGAIKNFSGQRILVRTYQSGAVSEAIVEPGGEVSYMLLSAGTLHIFRAPEGQAVGDPAKLWLKDPYAGRPSTAFTPPGRTDPVTTRTGWGEGESHHEIWGGTTLWVKRETDGWRVPLSEEFIKRYGNPYEEGPGYQDWAIFSIHIDSL